MKKLKDYIYFQDENFTLYCGDCLEVMRLMETESMDIGFTSPPYNMKTNVGGFFNQKKVNHIWKNAKLREGYEDFGDNLPYEDYCKQQREVLTEMLRLTRDAGAVFYNHKWRIQKHKLLQRQEITDGFDIREIIIWNRGTAINYNYSHLPPTYEVIYNFAKKDFRYKDRGRGIGNVLSIPPERNNPHPAPYPVELPLKIIEKTKADVIFDPYMGSGTTAIASYRLGRKCIGIELSPKYCEMTKERYLEEKAQNRLL